MPKKRAKMKARNGRPGLSLELAVARIQQMMDKNSTVENDVWLTDRVGNRRQYDIVVRGMFGGRPMLGVIECKDHNRKKGPADVEAFAKKTENLGANFRMIVSKKGFTRQALTLARHEFVSCASLLPNDSHQTGFAVGQFWYGIVTRWKDCRIELAFNSPVRLATFSPESLLWQGKPIANWFLNELFTNYCQNEKPGNHCLVLEFPNGLDVVLNEATYNVSAIRCFATLEVARKRKWTSWLGDAFFDWEKNVVQIPAGTSLVTSGVETDPACWDDYDGDVPSGAGINQLEVVILFVQRLQPEVRVPNLMNASPNLSFTLVS